MLLKFESRVHIRRERDVAEVMRFDTNRDAGVLTQKCFLNGSNFWTPSPG